MAEWCMNSEVITGPVKEISFLYLSMCRWLQSGSKQYILENRRIQRIVEGAGLNDLTVTNMGTFDELPELRNYNNGGLITFVTQTAWGPCPEVWREIIKRCAPNCQYYYLSICESINQFLKYDPTGRYFPEEYFVNGMQDDPDVFPKILEDIAGTTYEEGELLKLLQKLFNRDINLHEMIDIFNKEYCKENLKDKGEGDNWLEIFPIEEFKGKFSNHS